ncbi:MAG: bifunctional folylpolyglutamate synthase/dihydrofolate synthase [Deltaproteobacteria bacterium]|nr:bifunctional folylpolyglutamate synthase/dihydrofolate synthase [Deltaproteobacteria bacterium]
MKKFSVIDHILSLEKRGMLFGLDNIRAILRALGNPEGAYMKVHVGGTNGKGSVTTILSKILTQEGFKTGKYTSPHLHSITERFSVNDKDVEYETFVGIAEYIWQKIEEEKVEKTFTFFDFTTAVAFEYFKRESVDIAVIEVGLGGRLDSTNVITPLVSIITNVGYDHMDYLGKTLRSIATEKSGIIKDNVPVVTGTKGISQKIISQVAREKSAPLYVLGKDFSFEKVRERQMNYMGINWKIDNLYINLLGDHQFFNTSLALCALEILSNKGFPVKESTIREALSDIKWKGRLEVVRERPTVILDGAHNPSGMAVLTEYVNNNLEGKRVICVFGVMKDKDYRRMAKFLSSWTKELIITKPSVERALEIEKLKRVLPFAYTASTVEKALVKAKELAKSDDVIVVTGSLFTVAEARALINEIF